VHIKSIIVLTILLPLTIIGCGDKNEIVCDEDHPKVKFARQLSGERLKALFDEMKKLKQENNTLPHEMGSKNMPIPEPFKDINPIIIHSERALPTIVLKSCFDHYIMLLFYGINEKEEKKIVLMWGEGPTLGKQILWSEKG